MWNPSTWNRECNKTSNIDKYLDIKNCSCRKRLFGKLVLSREDEILNTTEASLGAKKVTWKKFPTVTIEIILSVFLDKYLYKL